MFREHAEFIARPLLSSDVVRLTPVAMETVSSASLRASGAAALKVSSSSLCSQGHSACPSRFESDKRLAWPEQICHKPPDDRRQLGSVRTDPSMPKWAVIQMDQSTESIEFSVMWLWGHMWALWSSFRASELQQEMFVGVER